MNHSRRITHAQRNRQSRKTLDAHRHKQAGARTSRESERDSVCHITLRGWLEEG
jgi:hypothetical protein